MSDPTLGNWALGILGSLFIAVFGGVGAFWADFRNSRKELYANQEATERKLLGITEKIEVRMDRLEGILAAHATEQAVLNANLSHVSQRFTELQTELKETTKAVQSLLAYMKK